MSGKGSTDATSEAPCPPYDARAGGGVDRLVSEGVVKQERLSLATVLSGDDPLVDDLVGVGLSWMEGRALYLPIAHRYIGAPEPLPQDEVLAILKPLLENSLLPKLAEDVKAQDLIWSRLGVTFRGASLQEVGLCPLEKKSSMSGSWERLFQNVV